MAADWCPTQRGSTSTAKYLDSLIRGLAPHLFHPSRLDRPDRVTEEAFRPRIVAERLSRRSSVDLGCAVERQLIRNGESGFAVGTIDRSQLLPIDISSPLLFHPDPCVMEVTTPVEPGSRMYADNLLIV